MANDCWTGSTPLPALKRGSKKNPAPAAPISSNMLICLGSRISTHSRLVGEAQCPRNKNSDGASKDVLRTQGGAMALWCRRAFTFRAGGWIVRFFRREIPIMNSIFFQNLMRSLTSSFSGGYNCTTAVCAIRFRPPLCNRFSIPPPHTARMAVDKLRACTHLESFWRKVANYKPIFAFPFPCCHAQQWATCPSLPPQGKNFYGSQAEAPFTKSKYIPTRKLYLEVPALHDMKKMAE